MSRNPQSGSQPAAARNGNGNGQRRRSGSRAGGRQAQKADIWREAEPLPELEKIIVSRDATALLRSLGEPPMNGAIEAGYTFGAVIERAAGIATALAFSAGILADQPE
ncbi:MAG TPA: hypothetical protein PK020_02680 [Ilumatobacteraceae bacterium]|nr:hypothetical protein [Ilumatobacteraceae bacterium]HRB04645.1 hypothetical protein [Ilumatobacteraceae bacterium]